MKTLNSEYQVVIEGLDNFDYSGRGKYYNNIRVIIKKDDTVIHDSEYQLKQGNKLTFLNNFKITLE